MYLYITGRGHSGSTILDILLGNSSQIESVGELLAGLSRADREPCSCGATMSDCGFWREVRSRVEAESFLGTRSVALPTWTHLGALSMSGPTGYGASGGLAEPIATIAHRARIMRVLRAGDHDDLRQVAPALLQQDPGARPSPAEASAGGAADPSVCATAYASGSASSGVRHTKSGSRMRCAWKLSPAETSTVSRVHCNGLDVGQSDLRRDGRAFPGRVVRVRFEDL